MNRLWFNPRCSTARKSLELLRAQGIEPELRRYLEEPPTKAELLALLGKLDGAPREIVRAKEAAYGESGLSEASTADEIVDAIVGHPILLQRPILELDERALVGRPPERVLELVAGG